MSARALFSRESAEVESVTESRLMPTQRRQRQRGPVKRFLGPVLGTLEPVVKDVLTLWKMPSQTAKVHCCWWSPCRGMCRAKDVSYRSYHTKPQRDDCDGKIDWLLLRACISLRNDIVCLLFRICFAHCLKTY
jgi:hypothetical protein